MDVTCAADQDNHQHGPAQDTQEQYLLFGYKNLQTSEENIMDLTERLEKFKFTESNMLKMRQISILGKIKLYKRKCTHGIMLSFL